MKKNSYINIFKNPKIILALSITLIAVGGLYTYYTKNHGSFFATKSNIESIDNTAEDSPEILSVVVTHKNSEASEIDVSAPNDVESTSLVEQEKTEERVFPNKIKHNYLDNNLKKLVVVHNLISKFFQNIEYSAELEELKKSDLPKNLIVILTEMEGYNSEYLMGQQSDKSKVIFPDEGIMTKMIGRFIKIEKNPTSYIQQKNMHDSIAKNIHIIEEYFYSRDFINRLSDND